MPTTVAVAVITYQRSTQLAELLASLEAQELPPGHTCRIVVVDNDPDGSAAPVVEAARGPHPIAYVVEPDPGIPAARQRSVEETRDADAVVFVDDDETVPPGWLARLLTTMAGEGADVVTGPVRGLLPDDSPRWAEHSDVYTSVGRHRTGDRLPKAYTNNTIVSRQVLDTVTPAFHPAFRFTGSSDLHFFLRVAKAGFAIVWDDEAVVTETVPPSRVTIRWLLRRAFRSGAGDTISRTLIRPGLRTTALCTGLGLARIANGVVLQIPGLVRPAARIKGLRRVASGVGSIAGLFGINHEEYRRQTPDA